MTCSSALVVALLFVLDDAYGQGVRAQNYQIGQMPIECVTWMDCYPTREPLLAIGSEWRYTSKGCACLHDEAYGELNLFCGIERRRQGELKLEVLPCAYCGTDCDDSEFFAKNAAALQAWQDRRNRRFRPVSAGAQPPSDSNSGPVFIGAPLNLTSGGSQSQTQYSNGGQSSAQSSSAGQSSAQVSSAGQSGASGSQSQGQSGNRAGLQKLLTEVDDVQQRLQTIENDLRAFGSSFNKKK